MSTVAAGLSLPVGDLIADRQYHTVFGRRLVVSLGAADEQTDLPPPAPGAPGSVPATGQPPR